MKQTARSMKQTAHRRIRRLTAIVICFAGGVLVTAAAADPGAAETAPPNGEALLRRIDANLSADSRIVTATMIIHGRRGTRRVTSRTWAQGEARAFTEYLAPPREKGTRMLKLDDNLWLYSPRTDRTIRISGHMLRQSVMGSDLSYEDMMEDARLAPHYRASVDGVENVDGRSCYRLTLEAVTTGAAYARRTLWVDRERWIPLKQALYARSGKLLKQVELKEIERIQERWYPRRIIFKDVLKSGDGTELVVEEIRFNVDIPEHIFSKAALR